MKSKLIIGVIVLSALLLAGQAMAADPIWGGGSHNWNGFYAGVNVGGGWTSNSVQVNSPFGSVEFDTPDLDAAGVIGGGQAGYNWLCGCWLFGVEADFQGANLSKTVTAVDTFSTDTVSFEQSLDWFGTVRGRAGWLVTPCLLIYGTGGFAYGEVQNSATFGTTAAPALFEVSSSSVQSGWTAGGGIEWGINKCWSVKAEYLFMDLGSRSIAVSDAVDVELKNNVNIARVGLNFKF